MILVRAPLRISFVGGGTDLPNFYKHYPPGCVISTAIDKFVYVGVNKLYRKRVVLKYSLTEDVASSKDLKHNRVKEALLDLDIKSSLEIVSLADVPAKLGLGSSSSFSVALLLALNTFLGRSLNQHEAAEAACRLEIDLLREPIGKQDQYAAAYGGINIFYFNQDGSVKLEPIVLRGYKKSLLEKHMLLFSTGQFRDAATVLKAQSQNVRNKVKAYQEMVSLVLEFKEALRKGQIETMGQILHEGWQIKKTLTNNISNPIIDDLYQAGLKAGAWGGKILGAGGGGSLFFLAPPDKHDQIAVKLKTVAKKYNMTEFGYLPVKLAQGGVEVLFKDK